MTRYRDIGELQWQSNSAAVWTDTHSTIFVFLFYLCDGTKANAFHGPAFAYTQQPSFEANPVPYETPGKKHW